MYDKTVDDFLLHDRSMRCWTQMISHKLCIDEAVQVVEELGEFLFCSLYTPSQLDQTVFFLEHTQSLRLILVFDSVRLSVRLSVCLSVCPS